MTHPRRTVRDSFATTVTGLGLTASRVYKTSVYELAEDQLPALRIYTIGDTADGATIGPTVMPLLRQIRIVCEAVAKANTGADDTVDAICEQVEAALTANPRLSGAVQRLAYLSFDQQSSGEGDRAVVVGRMTFEATTAS